MSDTYSHVLGFLRGFTRVLRSMRAYTSAHPQVKRDIDAAFAPLQELLAAVDPFVLGISEGLLVAQGTPVKDDPAIVAALAGTLKERQIASVKFGRGTTREEMLGLVRVLCMRPEEVSQEGRLRPEATRGFRHVSLNELRFTVLADGAMEAGQVLAESGVTTREKAIEIIEAYYRDVRSQPTPQNVARFLDGTRQAVSRMDEETASRTARASFERLAAEVLASNGVQELQSTMMRTIVAMPPEMRKLVFREHLDESATFDVFRLLRELDPRVRSSALVADLVHGRISPERLRDVITAMGPTPGEVVKLYELVSSQLAGAGLAAEATSEAMSRLFQSLRARWRDTGLPSHGTLAVLDPEGIGAKGYADELEKMGFTVLRFSDGAMALEEIERRGDVGCLILDIQAHGLSGLEVLAGLARSGRPVPAIVASRQACFREEFEVASYPRLRFLAKPVERAELRSAIEEFIPQPVPTAEEEGRVAPAELERARAIQKRLIPTEAPRMPGYDLAFHYRPAFTVGGDYIDFIPLPDGRVGLVVADVSGKNITGAMVMVMFRSVFRMVAPRTDRARDTLIEVSRYLSKDMPRAMFVSAVYGVLDPAAHTLTVANAGHNPPLIRAADLGLAAFLQTGGCAIGIAHGPGFERSIREEVIPLAPGDRVVMYTDGVVEAMDASKVELGEKPLLRLLNGSPGLSSGRLVDAIVGQIERHRGDALQSDDITILSLARCGSPEGVLAHAGTSEGGEAHCDGTTR